MHPNQIAGGRARLPDEGGAGDPALPSCSTQGRSLLDLVGLKQDLEDLVHRPVDVVTERALSPYLRDRVLSEAIPL